MSMYVEPQDEGLGNEKMVVDIGTVSGFDTDRAPRLSVLVAAGKLLLPTEVRLAKDGCDNISRSLIQSKESLSAAQKRGSSETSDMPPGVPMLSAMSMWTNSSRCSFPSLFVSHKLK